MRSFRRLLVPALAGLTLAGAAVPARAGGAGGAARWSRPVPGEVVRPFDFSGGDPFARGQHRGADLAAAPGTPVRAACSGRVVFAGTLPAGGRAVSVRCGIWRVSYLPLRALAVRRGAPVLARGRLGAVAAGHGGALHIGFRREGRAFGYVDPLARFGAGPSPPVAVRVPRRGPRPRAPVGWRPAPRVLPRAVPVAAPAPGLAPWPAWLGLGLVLSGAAGGASLGRRRRRRRALVPVSAGAADPA